MNMSGKSLFSTHRIFFLLIFVIGVLSTPVNAAVTLPYFCGFETQDEKEGWVFVNGESNAGNKWVIGDATFFKDKNSLYVTSDEGVTAGYTNTACLIAAYKEFDLPAGIYDISFDWKVAGDSVNNNDVLYACWIEDPVDPEDEYIVIRSNSTGAFPVEYQQTVKATLNSYASWRNCTFSIRGGVKGRLVFFWVNNNDHLIYLPAGCIDNIQIGRQNVCSKPSSFEVALDVLKENIELSWTGTADTYELLYKNVLTEIWDTIPGISGLNYSMPVLPAGSYAFWIRGICSNDTSIWTPYYYLPVMDYQNICLDFTNLKSSAIKGTYGKYSGTITPTNQQYAYTNEGIIDYGEESARSQHTVNTTYGQYDANTGFELRTIPPGEFTSVRLGNWRTGAEAESLSFTYAVDSTSDILLLKYAIVLQDPAHEHPMEQPQFLLEILDQNDNLMDEECGKVYFYAEEGRNGWITYRRNPNDNTSVVWKDWTTLGVNLTDYIGRSIKIRLTTFDCSQSAHYGYAYFTMNCTATQLTGLACGVEEVEDIEAPEGFAYEWYDPAYPDIIISNDRILNTTNLNEDVTYVCKIISLENPLCHFNLMASLLPVNVKAEANYTYTRQNCENKVEFESAAYVYTKRGKENREIDSYYWDFGNNEYSTEANPVVYYPVAGTYTVRFFAALNDEEGCEDIWTEEIEILPVGPTDQTFSEYICDGEEFIFGPRVLFESGVYTNRYVSTAGCDSMVTIDLTVYDNYTVSLNDTICTGESYELNGVVYTQSGSFTQRLTFVNGCDSLILLQLVVLPEVRFRLTSYPEIKGNDGRIVISNASYNYTYTINGEPGGDLNNLSAGEYTIVLYNAKKM